MTKPKLIYFAGKVEPGGGYRQELLSCFRMNEYKRSYHIGRNWLIYGGPLAVACDHGCFHLGSGRHGCGSEENTCTGQIHEGDREEWVEECLPGQEVVDRCLFQIDQCDAVHAYIDSFDCFGTLTELGYAAAKNKPMYLVFAANLKPDDETIEDEHGWIYTKPKDELWFIKSLPTVKAWCYGAPSSIHQDLLVSSPATSVPDKHTIDNLNRIWKIDE